jgi:hypothetical protein
VGCFEWKDANATGAIRVGSATRNGHSRALTAGDIEEKAHLDGPPATANPRASM